MSIIIIINNDEDNKIYWNIRQIKNSLYTGIKMVQQSMLLKASTKLYRNENTSKVCNELQTVTIIIYSQRHIHIQFVTF